MNVRWCTGFLPRLPHVDLFRSVVLICVCLVFCFFLVAKGRAYAASASFWSVVFLSFCVVFGSERTGL